MQYFQEMIRTSSQDRRLAALFRARFHQIMLVIYSKLETEVADKAWKTELFTKWAASLGAAVPAEPLASTQGKLKPESSVHRIKYGFRMHFVAGGSKKISKDAEVTVQFSPKMKKFRWALWSQCYALVPEGGCSGNKKICDHLENKFWAKKRTAYACANNMEKWVNGLEDANIEDAIAKRFAQKRLNNLDSHNAQIAPQPDIALVGENNGDMDQDDAILPQNAGVAPTQDLKTNSGNKLKNSMFNILKFSTKTDKTAPVAQPRDSLLSLHMASVNQNQSMDQTME
jgi:hypothetical protein